MLKRKLKIKLDRSEYDALYISDIHFMPEGSRYQQNNQDSLLFLLRSFKEQGIRFDKVFIVGDGLENWFVSSAHEFKNNPEMYHVLFESLEAISNKRFYIIGNHCTRSLTMKLPKPISTYLKKKKWSILKEYRDEKVVVVHGHQAQYNTWQWMIFIPFSYLLYNILRLVPGALMIYEYWVLAIMDFDKNKSEYNHFIYHKKLIKEINCGNKWLISGHTHKPIHFQHLKSINTGDWLTNKSFITQKNFDFKLWRYDDNKGITLIPPKSMGLGGYRSTSGIPRR
ncbi:putative UDP-2,3-diacylglucosamine hydrolase [Gammaproteobacteria bacterium]